METLPCGCHIGVDVIDGVRTFMIEPCHLTCEYYLHALDLSRRQGNTETFLDTR